MENLKTQKLGELLLSLSLSRFRPKILHFVWFLNQVYYTFIVAYFDCQME